MRHVIVLNSLIALLALAAACGGGGGEKPARTQTAAPTAAPSATPVPAAETLAFIRDGDIWLIDADGTGERRITQVGGTDREVESFLWSPNGQEILWVAVPVEKDSLAASVYELATADGKVLWRREVEGLSGVYWSLDGQLVALFEGTAVRIEDRDGRVIWTGTGAGARYLDWSNDSRHFALVDGNDIVVVAKDGSSTRLDVGPPLDVGYMEGGCARDFVEPGEARVLGRPRFTPDDKRLIVPAGCSAWSSGSYGQPVNIYEASLDGLVNRPLVVSAPSDRSICGLGDDEPWLRFCLREGPLEFSPDGSHIAYLSRGHVSCGVVHDLVLFDSAGGNVRLLLPGEIKKAEEPLEEVLLFWAWDAAIIISGFAWSPAGDAIAAHFEVENTCRELSPEDGGPVPPVPPGGRGLYLLGLDDHSEKKLADEAARNLSWSPTGDLLAYDTESPEGPQIRVLSVNTSEVRNLGPGTSPEWRPQP